MTFLVRYQLAVTRRKEEESQSSSIYYQNDIWTPTVAFADFINNETLLGEVGGSRDRGEGPFCVWCLGCPTPGPRLEGGCVSSAQIQESRGSLMTNMGHPS